MTAVRQSLLLSALDSYFGVALQLATTVIIARLLTPTEVGVFAVAAAFAALASTFRDFGVAEYLIQERAPDRDTIRSALTVNIAVSWVMALLLFGLAPAAASFYGAAGVGDVMRVQSINFLLIPFGAVTMAWFRRQMDFKPIMVANALSNAVAFVVAIGLALQGWSYMSLAWSSVVGAVVTVAASLWFRPKDFPKWPGVRGVGKVLHFGKFASGIYIFGQLGKGAPEMIIGRALDMAAVGMFSRASGLVEIFNRLVLRAVLPISLPYFAKGVRESGTPLPGVLMATSYLTAIGWPFLAFIGVAAYSAIRLLYGPQWIEAVVLAQVLCAVAAVELVHYAAKDAMLSVGRVKESNSFQMIVQSLHVAGLLAVIPFGLEGACWGLLGSAFASVAVAVRYLRHTIALAGRELLKAVLPSLYVAVASVAPMFLWCLVSPIDEDNYIVVGLLGGVATALLWIGSLRALKHPMWSEVRQGFSSAAAAYRNFVSSRA